MSDRVRWPGILLRIAGPGSLMAAGGAGLHAAEPMVVVPFEEARFEPVDAGRPERPQIAVLRGDPAAKGPSAMLLTIGRGEGPLHYHSSDYHLALLQGEMKHRAAGAHAREATCSGREATGFNRAGRRTRSSA